MKVKIEIDCTPIEARDFLGLPDVKPMQEAMMDQMQAKMQENIANFTPEALMRTWFSFDPKVAERFQDMFMNMAGLGGAQGQIGATAASDRCRRVSQARFISRATLSTFDRPIELAIASASAMHSNSHPSKKRRQRRRSLRSVWGGIMSNAPRQLSSVDASFLYLETPEMPMHVGSMAIFRLKDGYQGDFFEDFKAMIASRIHIAPILKSRLAKTPLDIDHPSWVEDDQFDIDRHIFRASLPAPHNRAILERTVGWMHAKLLNRARPLWEFYVFEGMENNEIGLYSKIHHACIDGGAGAALTNMIYDISPVPREVPKPAGTGSAPSASRATSPRTSSIPTSSSGASRSARRRRRTSRCRASARAISARCCSTTRCSRSRTR